MFNAQRKLMPVLEDVNVRCREAKAADKAPVIAIWRRCELTRPWNDPSVDFSFAHASPNATVLVLEIEREIVAAALIGHDGHRGAAYYVGVDPKFRAIGAGRKLMCAAEEWLRARGVWKLNLLVRRENAAVLNFYEKLGYADQDCIALGKRLDNRPDRALASDAQTIRDDG